MFPGNYNPARVYFGEIIGVDPSKYTCRVKLHDGRILSEISWLSPYSFLNGNGMYIMPQPRAAVLVLEYLPGSFTVLGFPSLAFRQSLDRTNNKRRLSLGDICIQGSDQCYMLLRRGCEVIELQTTPKCKVILNSNDNTILIDSQRFKHVTDSGVMIWDSDPQTRDTAFHWTIRDKADPSCNLVEVIIGFHVTEDPDAIAAKIDKSVFSLIVKEVSSSNDSVNIETKLKIIIGANGRILCDGESVMEKYKDFIDRYADTYITDIAKNDITRTSLEKNIMDTAKEDLTRTSLEKSIADTAKEDLTRTSLEKSIADTAKEDLTRTSLGKGIADTAKEDLTRTSGKSIVDTAKEDLMRTSGKSIVDTAKVESLTVANLIRHNKF